MYFLLFLQKRKLMLQDTAKQVNGSNKKKVKKIRLTTFYPIKYKNIKNHNNKKHLKQVFTYKTRAG